MASSVTRPSTPAAASRPSPAPTLRRISFLSEVEPGAKLRREFSHPCRAFAVEDVVALSDDFPVTAPWPEPTDSCCIVVIPRGTSGDAPKEAEAWVAAPADRPQAVPPVVVEREDATIRWRPGRAVVQARPERCDDAVAALTDFAFYEGELRTLEAALAAHESQAQEDVARAYRVRQRDRKHWKRFGALIENFARMRLTFARLEPQLAKGSRSLSPEARRLTARLLRGADVEARLEAVSDRLEALEDLYEGATDRAADFRWYRNGHLLEIGILLLLVVECVLMSGDIYMHYREREQLSRLADATQEAVADDSEEFRATITKIADGKVTFFRTGLNDAAAADNGEEQTYPVAANLKVYRGKIDKETKDVEAGEALPGGVKNEAFTRVKDKGLRAVIVTDAENQKIAEIYVLPPGKKGQ